MIKFIHKKHINKNSNLKSFVIYYSISDIVLGFLLTVLVAFFIYNYVKLSFQKLNIVYYRTASSSFKPGVYRKG